MTKLVPLPKRSELISFRPGKILKKKYRILSADANSKADLAVPLGDGGSGVVFLAEQELRPGIIVKRALKFFVYRDNIAEMTQHQASGPISATQFQDELLNLSTFNHENILKVIEADIYKTPSRLSVPYVVTEFVEGPTLKKVIDTAALADMLAGDVTYAVELVLQLCKGVSHLHSRQFFHCDIAPKNVFLKGQHPDLQVVLGDLGVGRSKTAKKDGPIFVIGTRDYCPPKVQDVMYKGVKQEDFFALQPAWDVFALASTSLALLDSLPKQSGRLPWLDALQGRLQEVIDSGGQTTAKALAERVEWLRPMQQTIAGVQELAESYPSHRRTLLPVEAVTTSYRIRRLSHHPAMLRLSRVPQLVMVATTLFPGATHTRYEHALGTYQTVRRYLLALIHDERFLAAFSPADIECCLVSALLSGITRFPFSTIVHEIKSGNGHLFSEFSRTAILDELFESDDFRNRDGFTLAQVIAEHFPRVSIQQVRKLVSGDKDVLRTVPGRFIHFLLNSSIDARVVDYLLRDSLHLGLPTAFDLGDLLLNVVFDRGKLLLRTSALSAVEQIISLRFWLFNRIYWNQPNRATIAMIRHVLHTLATTSGKHFEKAFRAQVLHASEESLLAFFAAQAKQIPDKRSKNRIAEVVGLLRERQPRRFEEIHQCNRGEDDAISRQICDRLCVLSASQLEELQERVNEVVVGQMDTSRNSTQVLIDVPVERGLMKLGDDLNVLTHNKDLVPLERFSGIVSGVRRGFQEQLQRVRVFVNPNTLDGLAPKDRERLRLLIKSELETVV